MRLSSSILCYPREGCDSQSFSEFDTSRECCIESKTGRSYDSGGAAEHCHTCEGIIICICLLLTSLTRLIPGYAMGVTDCEICRPLFKGDQRQTNQLQDLVNKAA